MTPLERLQLLQAATGLIAANVDKTVQVNRCAEFTRRAAYELRDLGWGNIAKTSGANVQGLSIDKMVNPRAQSLTDIIVDTDGDNPSLAWQERPASLAEAQLYVAPLAPPDVPAPPVEPPPPEPPLPPDVDDIDARIEALLGDAVDALGGVVEVVTALTVQLRDIREHGVSLHIGGFGR